ncbi:hypothetical protein H5410_006458 [Solanum commersonii]|uniref:Uncharacterized protein n=1 Tax=Solanum commersonii TaxID=4109 RepID=A0A9J6A9W5_SOLCO|nr:hypothetical protein H5410_006458 [Solanum commersonii]
MRYLEHMQCIVLKEKNVKDMHSYCSITTSDALAKTYEIPMVPMPDKEDWSLDDVVVEAYPPRYEAIS